MNDITNEELKRQKIGDALKTVEILAKSKKKEHSLTNITKFTFIVTFVSIVLVLLQVSPIFLLIFFLVIKSVCIISCCIAVVVVGNKYHNGYPHYTIFGYAIAPVAFLLILPELYLSFALNFPLMKLFDYSNEQIYYLLLLVDSAAVFFILVTAIFYEFSTLNSPITYSFHSFLFNFFCLVFLFSVMPLIQNIRIALIIIAILILIVGVFYLRKKLFFDQSFDILIVVYPIIDVLAAFGNLVPFSSLFCFTTGLRFGAISFMCFRVFKSALIDYPENLIAKLASLRSTIVNESKEKNKVEEFPLMFILDNRLEILWKNSTSLKAKNLKNFIIKEIQTTYNSKNSKSSKSSKIFNHDRIFSHDKIKNRALFEDLLNTINVLDELHTEDLDTYTNHIVFPLNGEFFSCIITSTKFVKNLPTLRKENLVFVTIYQE
eukprot:TRINITY_DN1447_c0_g1_i1.p1 TRINITY_DN1447_c0_g1~~TRINITY_DN1447_c0_g1_i1.p1  ORF type:complete len:447 (+),score=104.60 TRINITY_DN1447_c0_g1_i1:45-1343(+)